MDTPGTFAPIQDWLIAGGVLLAFCAPGLMILRGLVRSQRADDQDILEHGMATSGTVTTIERNPIRGGYLWTVTVEFTVLDRPDPVRFSATVGQMFWAAVPTPLKYMEVGKTVALHYREKWPSLAVIDVLVS